MKYAWTICATNTPFCLQGYRGESLFFFIFLVILISEKLVAKRKSHKTEDRLLLRVRRREMRKAETTGDNERSLVAAGRPRARL